VSFLDTQGNPCAHVATGDALIVRVSYRANKAVDPGDTVLVGISINHLYEPTSVSCTNELTNEIRRNWPVEGTVSCKIPRLPLTAGTYYVNIYLAFNGIASDWVQEAAVLQVEDGDFFHTGTTPFVPTSQVLVPHSWELANISNATAAA
jgi:hypothetical protein